MTVKMKNKRSAGLICVILCLVLSFGIASSVFAGQADPSENVSENISEYTSEAICEEMAKAFEAYKEEAKADPVRQQEVTPIVPDAPEFPVYQIERNGNTMKYMMEVIGEPDESGLYPLYITLHGGGDDTEAANTEQWGIMFDYYKESVDSGIYVACRGMEDTWNMHFLDKAYDMYDRLIEDMILLKDADPDRVYLLGFSAGGDGVYAVTPRMADRFAAANMSSGHPNDEKLLNVANVPFEIQAGILDYYTADARRSVRAAEFEQILSDYHNKYDFGYTHRVLIHVPEGHNYNDYSDDYGSFKVLADPAEFARREAEEGWLSAFMDIYADYNNGEVSVMEMSYYALGEDFEAAFIKLLTEELGMNIVEENPNAVRYVSQFKRNPRPEHIVWDLSSRAKERKVTSFYWLQADMSVDQGIIQADFDAESNTFTLNPSDDVNGDFDILIDPHMVDFSRPVNFVTPEDIIILNLTPDPEIIKDSIAQTGDLNLAWAQKVSYSQLTGK